MKTRDSYKIIANNRLNDNIYSMQIMGKDLDLYPGQFVNVTIPGVFLPRPISVSDYKAGILTLVYRVVGEGTEIMANMKVGDEITLLTGLGNGFDLEVNTQKPLVVGGGLGVAPLYYLTRKLIEQGKEPRVILGFKSKDEAFYLDEFNNLIVEKRLGYYKSHGTFDVALEKESGTLVTDFMNLSHNQDYDYFYACGPKPMLKAVSEKALTDGEVSLEERMACGIGQCKCCSIETNDGMKTLCHDGPVLKRNMVRW